MADNASNNGLDMILEIPSVWPLFEVIAPSVRQDSRVNDVDLADTPTVEAFFPKEMFKNTFIADLNIAFPCSETSKTQVLWYGAEVG